MTTVQQDVAQYLRELADKVERSRYCIIATSSNERKYVTMYQGRGKVEHVPTGEREVTLKLNYIEEDA